MSPRSAFPTLLLSLLALLAGGAPSSAQDNLVSNGDFDAGLAGWQIHDLADIGTFDVTHDPAADALGQGGSGAMSLAWDLDLTGEFARVGFLQCLGELPPGEFFRLGYAHRGDRLENVELTFFVGEDCAGGGSTHATVTTDGTEFQFWQLTAHVEDPEIQSVGVRLRFGEIFGALQQGTAHLDKVFVRESSTIVPLVATAAADTGHGQVVHFTGGAGGGASPYPPNFLWDFGDGETSTEQNPVHVYDSPGLYDVMLTVDTGFEQAEETQLLDVEAGLGCVPGATTLCIDDVPGDGRFELSITFHSVQGGGVGGQGQAVDLDGLGITRGGLFWFFNPANPEMLVKVLNACSFTGHYWVFYSAGTNVGFTLTVRDTISDLVWTDENPDLSAAPPVQDTEAFPCDAAAASSRW